MSNLFSSSIGKKLIMSVTGLFLVLFLLLHLSINLLLIFSEEAFNEASHFMATNPVIYVMQYILAAGFIIHITWASMLTLQNRAARPVKYSNNDPAENSTWSSRNMYVLGSLILIFLFIHIFNFFYKIKFSEVENDYELVTGTFRIWYFSLIYILGFVFLGLHLNHAFHSAFQTIGWSNKIWMKRLKIIGTIYAIVISIGFAIIPLFFLIPELF
ncbi:MAG: succinate dehydrogenase cytochrome b subunit [Chlorobi bacterium]|nr:succinate dehydrogenase cytochrome b subunit [Chlorobiota bacterium]